MQIVIGSGVGFLLEFFFLQECFLLKKCNIFRLGRNKTMGK